jgi:hypothetical protein
MTTYAGRMRRRGLAHRLPLTGVAVAGAVVGHMVAYVLAVPEPTARMALLGATGHAYWTEAIAAALVLGLVSLAATLWRFFRAGLAPGRPAPGESVAGVAGRLTGLQVAIYLVQETLERLEAGLPPHTLGRLLVIGVGVQVAIAALLALLLTLAGRAAEAVGRALRRVPCRRQTTGPTLVDLVAAWPSRLLATGLGCRAPPHSLAAG